MKKSIANTAAVLAILGSVAFPWSDPRDPVPASHRAMRNVAAVPFDFSDIPFLKDERTEIALDEPYELDFTIEKTSDGQYALVATMELFGGSFYVSPHSTGDFKGKFRVEVAPNKDLEIGSDFTEEPRSKEVFDLHPFVGGPVNWVKEDTRYTYPLIIHSEKDFSIGGKIIFTIEPKCTLEDIPLIFKYRSGVLTVEKWEC